MTDSALFTTQRFVLSAIDERNPPPIGDVKAVTRLKTAAAFCAEYVPLSYTIEPIIRSRSLYTLTAKTGSGKTAFMVAAALAVATGRGDILSVDVEAGRVAYLAFENPDDVRMRLMIAAYLLNVNLREIDERLVILDVRRKPEDVAAALNGEFTLILADTLAAWFDGKDINDNVQLGEFVRRVRPLTALPGNPSVVVAAHPVKNASDDNLIPYGGGAALNEVDGNLVIARKQGETNVRVHWQGKLRGLDFAPRPFRFEIVGSPDILDTKSRQVQLPVIRPISEEDAEARAVALENQRVKILRALDENPNASLAEIGNEIGLDKHKVNRTLKRLEKEKPALTHCVLGKWTITKAGKAALRPFAVPQIVRTNYLEVETNDIPGDPQKT
jgi:rhodanese-related sulfurtransferase